MFIRIFPAIAPVILASALPAFAVEARFDDTVYPDNAVASASETSRPVVTPDVTYPSPLVIAAAALPSTQPGEDGRYDDVTYAPAAAPASHPTATTTTVASRSPVTRSVATGR